MEELQRCLYVLNTQKITWWGSESVSWSSHDFGVEQNGLKSRTAVCKLCGLGLVTSPYCPCFLMHEVETISTNSQLPCGYVSCVSPLVASCRCPESISHCHYSWDICLTHGWRWIFSNDKFPSPFLPVSTVSGPLLFFPHPQKGYLHGMIPTSALLPFWAGSFSSVGAALCFIGWLTASPTH